MTIENLQQFAINKKRSVIELKSPVDDICSICIETVRNKRTKILPCGHRYHVSCINKWLDCSSKNTCPDCRCVVDESKSVVFDKTSEAIDYVPILDLLRFIEESLFADTPSDFT